MRRLERGPILRAGVSFHFGTSELKLYPFIDASEELTEGKKHAYQSAYENFGAWRNGANPGNIVPYPGVTYCAHICEDLAQLQRWTMLKDGGGGEIRHFCELSDTHTEAHGETIGSQIMKMNSSSLRSVYTFVCAKNGDESVCVSVRLLALALVSGVTDFHMDLICCSVLLRASCQNTDPHNPYCRQQLPWTEWTQCMPSNSGQCSTFVICSAYTCATGENLFSAKCQDTKMITVHFWHQDFERGQRIL